MLQKGYLVVANFAGYEAFLTRTEPEHAQSIVNDLLTTLLDNIKPPLVFFKLEGDAVFVYTAEGSFIHGKTLLEVVENLYCTFARTLETMYRNTVCTCQAGRHMTSLDLKFVIHYGAYSFTQISDKEDLIGSDVIILRELMKSPIADAVGIEAFTFITSACADAMGLNGLTDGMKTYSANYENLGEINGFAYDLRTVWQFQREHNRIRVNPDDAWLEVETDLPVSPALAWEYVTEPGYRSWWLAANEVTAYTDNKGRVGIGTTYICAHGKYKINQVIIDWRPFEYLTVDTAMPMKGMQRHTTQLISHDSGTRVSWRFDQIIGRNRIHTLILRLLFIPMKGKMMSRLKHGGAKVLEKIENDIETGQLTTKP
jgi:uncharacterized protein YndB with AHSA1/START domain